MTALGRALLGLLVTVGMLAPTTGVATGSNLPTCTSYSTFHESELALHIPTVGFQTRQWNCAMGPDRPVSNQGGLRQLLDALNRCYGFDLVYDGIYGARVVAAVKRVQWRHGLPQTGSYDPRLRDAMLWPGYDSAGQFRRCV